MTEAPESRRKRMTMRARRRGIKEMDLILGRYAEDRLEGMDAASLDLFDALLWENDQEIYSWVTGQAAPPERFGGLVGDIAVHSGARN